MNITIIRIDGTEEQHAVDRPQAFATILGLIAARTLEVVNLRDGRVMCIDEDGYDVEVEAREPPPGYDVAFERVPVRARKPANAKATALYHAICVVGTTHQIVGDVAIVRDADFNDDDDVDGDAPVAPLKVTMAEADFDRVFRRNATRVAPGIWIDRFGDVHYSVPELLALVDLADTADNRASVAALVRDVLAAQFPATPIVFIEPPKENV